MTRGDQRERARAKNMAKQQDKGKAKEGRPDQRNASDAAALAAKVEAKKARQATEPNGTDAPAVIRKKFAGAPGQANLDDLLSAGLSKKK